MLNTRRFATIVNAYLQIKIGIRYYRIIQTDIKSCRHEANLLHAIHFSSRSPLSCILHDNGYIADKAGSIYQASRWEM